MPPPPSRTTPHSPARRAVFSYLRPRVFAVIAGLTALTATFDLAQQPLPTKPPSDAQPRPDATASLYGARVPDANDRMQMQQQQTGNAKLEAANAARRKQLVADADKLLQLATELKAQVDKTDKDTLSLQVIRKAESIEKLAKDVKERMKLTSGAS